LLKAIVVYFPRTGADEDGDAKDIAAESKVHGQGVSADKQAVIPHVGQMLFHGFPFRQAIDL